MYIYIKSLHESIRVFNWLFLKMCFFDQITLILCLCLHLLIFMHTSLHSNLINDKITHFVMNKMINYVYMMNVHVTFLYVREVTNG